ncbi:hypothetical protein [Bacillus sp. ISL-7]|uniref:hypothetical protein n=1 Tax=Bacillus sp. ISL-7 TaxID=2819136 RepID=UPI001BE75169|nr:hypothetical protein [Bacillus sp. ISL-7]MBT2735177.1 hypothetical protein [Bacillus sp. ISL-7]
MDRKTLEYMEERAKKARKVVSRINLLQERIEKVKNAEKVLFIGYTSNGVNFEEKENEIFEELVATYIGVAEEEIQRLEIELAEL